MDEPVANSDTAASGAGWARMKAVFLAALDRPAGERTAFVAGACAGDDALRREVESLLASDEAAASFCETPAVALLGGPGAPPEAVARRLATGSRLGVYEVTGFLGAGGMGEVYRAHDTRLHREVAIKTLGAHLSDAGAKRRLLKEARHASGLAHPNICTIHEVGEAEDVPYIVMAYVDGRSLREVCRPNALPAAEAVALGIQIAGALAHAHARGIVHRDLKSSNIVLQPDGRAIVLDFGLATSLPDGQGARAAESTVTLEHGVAGTLDYIAPEVLLGSRADARSDVWAIGVLLYEMVTGRLPFSGRTSFETSSAIIGEPPDPLPRRVPLGLRLLIERCLAKEPARRYEHAGDLRAALEKTRRRGLWSVADHLRAPTRRQLGWTAAAVLTAGVLFSPAGRLITSMAGPARDPITTLAVLPVEFPSGDGQAQHLAEGITEALVAQIGALGAVRVISRTSAERLARADMPPSEVGRALGADAVVQATLHPLPDRVRMDVRLVHTAGADVLWSDTFERRMRDVLVLQSDIVRAVAASISITLHPDTRERLAMVRTVNPEAYEAYLKGRFHWNRRTQESLQLAVELFTTAVTLDPTYAPAHAALADCYNQLGTVMVGTGSPRKYRPLAAAEAIRALQIDPHSAEAHAALGYVRHYEWQWEEAEQAFRRSIELNPSYALARLWYANMLVSKRRFDEALREVSVARDLDPFSLVVNTNIGWVLQLAGRHEEAAAQLTRTLELDPDYPQAHMRLGNSMTVLGQHEAALRHAERAMQLTGRSPFSIAALASVQARAGRRVEAERLLAELLAMQHERYVPPHTIATVYAALQDVPSQLLWTEKAFAEGSNSVAYLAVASDVEELRRHPQFLSLLERTGLD